MQKVDINLEKRILIFENMSKLFNRQREKDHCLLAIRSAHGMRASSQSRASVHEVAPSCADLFSRVASSLCSSYLNCGKMARMKTTPKNLVIKKSLRGMEGEMWRERCHGRLRAGPDSNG